MLPFAFGEPVYGALNWVNVGKISFQPSEIAKILYVIAVAQFLEDYKEKDRSHMIKVIILTGIILLILVIQNDFGTAALYGATFIVLVYIATCKIRYPLIITCVGALGALMIIPQVSHIQSRINSWLDPWGDITNTGYQVVQGMFAMGTWGIMGSGLTRGQPTKVPFVTTDFIFVAIVEELGVIIGMGVIISYLLIAIWGIMIGLSQRIRFYRYIIMGYTTFIVIQSFIMLGGVLQLIPITGITLPFVSYGGSSILSAICMMGIMIYLSKQTVVNSINSYPIHVE